MSNEWKNPAVELPGYRQRVEVTIMERLIGKRVVGKATFVNGKWLGQESTPIIAWRPFEEAKPFEGSWGENPSALSE